MWAFLPVDVSNSTASYRKLPADSPTASGDDNRCLTWSQFLYSVHLSKVTIPENKFCTNYQHSWLLRLEIRRCCSRGGLEFCVLTPRAWTVLQNVRNLHWKASNKRHHSQKFLNVEVALAVSSFTLSGIIKSYVLLDIRRISKLISLKN